MAFSRGLRAIKKNYQSIKVYDPLYNFCYVCVTVINVRFASIYSPTSTA